MHAQPHYHSSGSLPGIATVPGFFAGQSGPRYAAAPASVSPTGFSVHPALSGTSASPAPCSDRPVPVALSAASAAGKNCLPLFPSLIFHPGFGFIRLVIAPGFQGITDITLSRLLIRITHKTEVIRRIPQPDTLFLPLSVWTGPAHALFLSGHSAVYHPEWPVAAVTAHSPVPAAAEAVHYPAPADG